MKKKANTLSKSAQRMIAPLLNELIVARMLAEKDPQDQRPIEFAKRSVVAKMLNLDLTMLGMALDDVRKFDGDDEIGHLAKRYAYWVGA